MADGEESGGFEEQALPLVGPLFRFARWLTGDRDEAEDLVQETMAKALRGYSGFTPGTSFKSWVFRILKNTFLTSRAGLRAHPLEPIVDEDALPAPPETPETILLSRASRDLVREAIAGLAPRFREVVLLRDVEGMRYQEIADTLGIPIGTVMSRLARGRGEIRAAIERKTGRR